MDRCGESQPQSDHVRLAVHVRLVLPVRTPKGKLLLYMGDRWNEGSESAPGSVGGASYIWLPMLHNRSDPTGYSMPILGGQWNGTGRWRISDYLLPD